MKIDIYRSLTNAGKYLSVPAGTDVEKFKFPPDLDKDLYKLSPFKTRLEISPDKARIGLDSAAVEKQINEKGFAIHGANIQIAVTVGKAP
ncbi:MAG TPA: hypothetical protein VNX02_11590 [Steroidobacteraceae bacterium]|jgi:hypothetical protein|nr:hypothetical protein [Steroidobacteraceae bacterium]